MAAFNLTLQPQQSEFVARPDTTLIQAYEITNNSANSLHLSSSIEAWQPSGADGSVVYNSTLDPHIQFSLNNADLKLGDTFTLAPKEHRQLVLKVKVAPDTTLSDSYYTFFINQLPTTQTPDTPQSQVTAKLGSHFLLSVASSQNPAPQAQINQFTTTPLIKDVFFTPITFQGQTNNTSEYFFKTFGHITVTKNGKDLHTLDLNPLNVLSHHSRTISCSPTIYDLRSNSCSLNPPFWPGAYTATLTLDASASAATASTTFFVFPLSPLILFLIIGTFFFFIRRFRHH